MLRLAKLCLLLLFCGCQAQNPFAAFGPARVPPPGAPSQTPYYPGTSPASGLATKPAPSLTSISADPPGITNSTLVAGPSDKEPIRIVENPGAPARMASAPRQPGSSQPPANSLLAPPPASGSSTPAAPPSPTLNGKSAGTSRLDANVAPAAYLQPVASPANLPSDAGWRAR